MESSATIIRLESEIDRLNKKIFFLEKSNRELEREVNDYVKRERELVSELEEMSRGKLNESLSIQTPISPSKSKEDFLNPKLPSREKGGGLEVNWGPVMFAYSDEIFLMADHPDLILYRDDSRMAYVSVTGRTVFYFPITQDMLDNYNITKIRGITPTEAEQITLKYGL